jgi:hypothetical protein
MGLSPLIGGDRVLAASAAFGTRVLFFAARFPSPARIFVVVVVVVVVVVIVLVLESPANDYDNDNDQRDDLGASAPRH